MEAKAQDRSSERSVADELAIRALVARYADAVNRRDEAAWAATWAEDGVWELFGRPLAGRAVVVATWRAAMGGFAFVVQLVHSGFVELAGERGQGRWTLSELGATTGGTRLLTLATYDDEYCRVDGAWLFARRRLGLLYQGPPDLSGPRPSSVR